MLATHRMINVMQNGSEKSRLLLIDDDRELGNMLRDFLAPDNIQLQPCLSGEKGLAEHGRLGFDLIILDIRSKPSCPSPPSAGPLITSVAAITICTVLMFMCFSPVAAILSRREKST